MGPLPVRRRRGPLGPGPGRIPGWGPAPVRSVSKPRFPAPLPGGSQAGGQRPPRLDDAWHQAAIARHFSTELRDELRRLRADRELLLSWVESAPRTFAHLDVWPDNLFDLGSELVLIDWGFAGIGAAAEDIGNLVPDSVFDLRHPASILRTLDRTVFEAYVAGLAEAGWAGDAALIRLAMCASACKYDWIAGTTLARAAAGTATQPIYGSVEVDPDLLFATRAEVLTLLVEWAAEARALARELDRVR